MSRFIKLWTHPDYLPVPVRAQSLQTAETNLSTRLPTDYRDAVIEFGLPRPTIALLDTICERELDLHDVNDFFSPEEIVETTEDWRDLGLPSELVAFANDCMGNLFCFPEALGASDQLPVFFWHLEEKSVEALEPSFTRWIDSFNNLSAH